MSQKESTLSSFKFAFRGISDAVKSEPNLRIHFFIALIALLLAYFLGFNLTEWAILAMTIGTVIIFELTNTCIEKIVDLLSPEISEKARIIKDISAGIVLISALTAVAVGLLLFLPKILQF
jgi:diacylglycerol kinase